MSSRNQKATRSNKPSKGQKELGSSSNVQNKEQKELGSSSNVQTKEQKELWSQGSVRSEGRDTHDEDNVSVVREKTEENVKELRKSQASLRPSSVQSKTEGDIEGMGSRRSVREEKEADGGNEAPSAEEDEDAVKESPRDEDDLDADKDNDTAGPEDTDQPMSSAIDERNSTSTRLEIEPWPVQKAEHWPESGKHIMAQYNDESVVVYQAFNDAIADYALENQKFGGGNYSFERMSWIKTNFLWMMYRSGWASKLKQERILAIRISRQGFDEILSKAYTAKRQREEGIATKDIDVRLQWDPDHGPRGNAVQRRAIQLGLKKETLRLFGTEYVQEIEDITGFVHDQHEKHLVNGCIIKLMTPKERVYPIEDSTMAGQIGVDKWPREIEREESVLF